MSEKATLKIRSNNEFFTHSIVELNGKSFPVRKLKLEGDIHSPWIVTAEFFISELDVELESTKLTILDKGEEKK